MTPNLQTTAISTFCISFHIFVTDEHRDFKFGGQVDNSRSAYKRQMVPERGMVTSRDPT